MFIDVNEIEEGDELRFDEAVPLGDLELGHGERVTVLDARLAGQAQRGESGVELDAALAARLRLQCSRCLEEYEAPLAASVYLTLVADGAEYSAGGARVEDDDATLFYAQDGRADLADIVTEQVLLNLPLKPLCAADCKGLCPACGSNQNHLQCDCRREVLDPRLLPLLELKKRLSGS